MQGNKATKHIIRFGLLLQVRILYLYRIYSIKRILYIQYGSEWLWNDFIEDFVALIAGYWRWPFKSHTSDLGLMEVFLWEFELSWSKRQILRCIIWHLKTSRWNFLVALAVGQLEFM